MPPESRPMTPEQWQNIEEWLDHALQLPKDARETYIQSVTKDEVLKRELRSLLTSAEQNTDHLGNIEAHLSHEMSLASTLEGQQIGAYRIERKLGEGGMGEVYLATREHQDFTQKVALKIIQKGIVHDDLRRRFQTERQILAHLHHPNIAQLLDGGTTEQGVPFLVMEYVEGKPITEYCDEKQLPISDRLQLFRAVCAAVQHAHQNLVIHRDIKPNNILVSPEGHVKLLDFGIAKVLSETAVSMFETQQELRMFTPAYTSPEIISGEAITTATDLYSLGILLYELLTGKHPYKWNSPPNSIEMLRLIREENPTRPSQAVDVTELASVELATQRHTKPKQLQSILRGDLDTILLKSLKKAPQERYAAAEQFSQDIQRYLDGQPILAQPDSFAYRTRKFVQRNRIVVAMGSGAFLLLTILSIGLAIQSKQLQDALKQAEMERDNARQVSEVLTNMFNADPFSAEGINPDSVSIRQFLLNNEATISRELKNQPILMATVQNLLARLNGNLSNISKAKELALKAYEIRTKYLEAPHENIAESLNQIGTILQYENKYDEAEQYFRQALAMREQIYPNGHVNLAESYNNLAVLLGHQDSDAAHAEELKLDLKSLEMRKRFLGEQHIEVSQSLNNLGAYYYYRKDWATSEKYYLEAIAIRRKVLGNNHPSLALTLNNYANIQRELNRLNEAEATMRQAIQIYHNNFGTKHLRLSDSYYGLHRILKTAQKYEAAENALKTSINIDETLRTPDHPFVFAGKLDLAKLYLLQNRIRDAETVLVPLHQKAVAKFPSENADRQDIHKTYCGVLQKQGKTTQTQQLGCKA